MSVPCNHPAVIAANWVTGQRLVLCESCFARAAGVARALGCPLFADELRDDETRCTQKVSEDKATPKEHP